MINLTINKYNFNKLIELIINIFNKNDDNLPTT